MIGVRLLEVSSRARRWYSRLLLRWEDWIWLHVVDDLEDQGDETDDGRDEIESAIGRHPTSFGRVPPWK